jgi:hypothetical protein
MDVGWIDFGGGCCQVLAMTATMILKEIQALPPDEKASLFRKLECETNETAKISEAELLRVIGSIGSRMRTSLSAEEMNAARREGRK